MHERSKFLIDPQVQWPIVGRYFMHWVLFVIYLVVVGTTVRILFAANTASLSTALDQAMATLWPTLAAMVVLLPVFLRDTMKFSNRFVGPMYRLRTELRNVAANRSVRMIHLRSGDFWGEAAEDFNKTLGRIERLEAENEELRQAIAAETASKATPVVVPQVGLPASPASSNSSL